MGTELCRFAASAAMDGEAVGGGRLVKEGLSYAVCDFGGLGRREKKRKEQNISPREKCVSQWPCSARSTRPGLPPCDIQSLSLRTLSHCTTQHPVSTTTPTRPSTTVYISFLICSAILVARYLLASHSSRSAYSTCIVRVCLVQSQCNVIS